MQSNMIGATGLAAAALLASPAAAPAQYESAPFLDSTVELSQALGLEFIAARLMLAERFQPPFDEELVEQFEDLAGSHWSRFGGSLAAADTDLAERLHAALEEVGEAANEGQKTSAPAAKAAAMLDDARAALISEELRESPPFQGALLVDLLLVEGGVAEGYEEAVEELWEYPTGWAGLQRVDVLWSGIADLATEGRRADAEEMITALHELFPDPGPPESVVGWNPEEAEAPAQRLAGIIEEVVAADLFPGRDMAGLAGHLMTVTEEACSAYETGNDEIAAEHVRAVFELYDGHLGPTAQLFAAEANEEAEESFAELAGVEEEDEDEEGGEEAEDAEADADGDADKADDTALSHADACANLSTALQIIRSTIGG